MRCERLLQLTYNNEDLDRIADPKIFLQNIPT